MLATHPSLYLLDYFIHIMHQFRPLSQLVAVETRLDTPPSIESEISMANLIYIMAVYALALDVAKISAAMAMPM